MANHVDESAQTQSQSQSQSKQLIAVVTGGNRGIGLEIVRLLAERHPQWIVYMASRSTEKGEAALTSLRSSTPTKTAVYCNVRVLQLDVNVASSITAAAAVLSAAHGRLDVLICNAGVMLRKPPAVAELVLQTNLYSVHHTLLAMHALLTASSEQSSQPPLVVVVSSEVSPWTVHQLRGVVRQRVEAASSWSELAECAADYVRFMADPTTAHFTWPAPHSTVYAYGISKALVSALIRLYARQYPHLTSVCSCPGYCATDMTAGAVGVEKRSAADGADSVLWVVEHRAEVVSGGLYQDGVELPIAQPRARRHRPAHTQQGN